MKPELKILTLNIGLLEIDLPLLRKITLIKGKSIRTQAIIHILQSGNYDIVLLQEVGVPVQKKLIKALQKHFPYHTTHYARKLFSSNLLILSKLPFIKTEFIPFSKQTHFESWGIQKGMLYGMVVWNNTEYHIVNTHLVSSGTGQQDTSHKSIIIRNEQIRQITEFIQNNYTDDDCVIIGGDFNMGPQTSTENYIELIKNFKDAMEHVHYNNRITWDPKNPLTRKRVLGDPAKQIDGFYLHYRHYDTIKNSLEINRAFINEISFEHNTTNTSTMISDHYGVEMIIKKTD